MSIVDIFYYGAMVLPLLWLGWLASRPFLVNFNRLLFVISGLLAYGFLQKALVLPLINAEKAHAEALSELGNSMISSEGLGHDLVFICYILAPLLGVLLLMFWLHCVLARSPCKNLVR